MAWSKTDTSVKAGHGENLGMPANFSAVPATLALELEQWTLARQLATELMQSGCVGRVGTFTVTVSGTATAGHPNGDTMTITVTNAS